MEGGGHPTHDDEEPPKENAPPPKETFSFQVFSDATCPETFRFLLSSVEEMGYL
jgi:hypothetical protein